MEQSLFILHSICDICGGKGVSTCKESEKITTDKKKCPKFSLTTDHSVWYRLATKKEYKNAHEFY